jgi:molecular chaperone GrpE
MADKKQQPSSNIPIRFFDYEDEVVPEDDNRSQRLEAEGDYSAAASEIPDDDRSEGEPRRALDQAELIAARAELKRLQTSFAEAQDALARRQADFENYRKRIERERGETHSRIVADVARKLLPVMDNLGRALEAERTIETQESKEFRHFLHGVELISKQLNEVLESFGIKPIAAVGEHFDPHVHEAVVSEPSDKYDPDTVTEEIRRGYRIGDRLLRPAMVKVAARKD